jgi:hypothetical protein
MITTADFKKLIAKPFGQEMRRCGFKGTGFNYFQETEEFLIAVFIEASRWGGSCSARFAIHPKEIEKEHNGKRNLSNLKIYQYEFIMSLTEYASGQKWHYKDEDKENLENLSKIIASIKEKAFPVIEKFKTKPNILELFEVTELKDFHKNWTKRTGVSIGTTDIRFAWAMTMFFEKKNKLKSQQFAKAGLTLLSKTDTFFGRSDFERVLAENNGAQQ